MSVLPQGSKLYADYLASGASGSMRGWYSSVPDSGDWIGRKAAVADPKRLADALLGQARNFRASKRTEANIERLRAGAQAVVTGQQVGLFGGPLLTLLKAATAIARAAQAEQATGVAHVPIFWLATEDHDLLEVDQVSLPSKKGMVTLRLGDVPSSQIQMPVGRVGLGGQADKLLDQVSELLGHTWICELLRKCYGQKADGSVEITYGLSFGRFLVELFSEYGLVVMDPGGREFHAMGAEVLRGALERAGQLEDALILRAAELEVQGYSAQVLVKRGTSLLFLISEVQGQNGVFDRQALRRTAEGGWKAGIEAYSTQELLDILDKSPERLSPSALLRPVFQDAILPTVAYVGGPAEIAYFAQSSVVYQSLLGRITAIVPRLTATLIDPAVGATMEKYQVNLEDVFATKTSEELTSRLGGLVMPLEEKRKLAAVENAMDAELTHLTDYFRAMDAGLGHSAAISANKMRYQMNRLRRLGSAFEVRKERGISRDAELMMTTLFPDGHLQERIIGGIWFLAQTEGLIGRLVDEATHQCPGHSVIRGYIP